MTSFRSVSLLVPIVLAITSAATAQLTPVKVVSDPGNSHQVDKVTGDNDVPGKQDVTEPSRKTLSKQPVDPSKQESGTRTLPAELSTNLQSVLVSNGSGSSKPASIPEPPLSINEKPNSKSEQTSVVTNPRSDQRIEEIQKQLSDLVSTLKSRDEEVKRYEVRADAAEKKAEVETRAARVAEIKTWTQSVALSVGVLIFSSILVCALMYLILHKGLGDEMFYRLTGLTIVISASLFVITAGFDNQQIAPMFGLLGSIAGYLFGRNSPARPDLVTAPVATNPPSPPPVG